VRADDLHFVELNSTTEEDTKLPADVTNTSSAAPIKAVATTESDDPSLPHKWQAGNTGQVEQSTEGNDNINGTVPLLLLPDIPNVMIPTGPVQPHGAPFSFAACVLMKDDNIILPEWLAYHYEVLPLRRLIVAVDPFSKTNPDKILDAYRDIGMNITVSTYLGEIVCGVQSMLFVVLFVEYMCPTIYSFLLRTGLER